MCIRDRWQLSSELANKAFSPRFVATKSKSSGSVAPSDHDLLFLKPGSYTFRMPEGFKRFESRVERPEAGDIRSPLTIEVWQEAEKVAEAKISPDQDFAVIKAAIEPEKRVKLVVLCDSPSQLGTEVQWKQPRLLR